MNLYHYTDQSGFLGIIENKELWATKIQYLNDHKEYRLAKEIAERALNHLLKQPEYTKHEFRIQRFIANLDNYINNNLCVSSLSEEGDLLSQWRGYSNSHGGYSIGFKKKELKELIESQGFNLEKCLYKEQDQVEVISKVIDECLDKFSDYVEPEQDFVLGSSDSTAYFLKKLSYVSSYIKDSNFSEEKEWRIIALIPVDEFDFRVGKSSLIPFKKITIGNNLQKLIYELIVGHSPNMDLAFRATQCLLFKYFPIKTQQPPTKVGGLVLRTKVRIRVKDPLN